MKPSQVVCSGCRPEDSPLSLDVLFPGGSCRLHVCFPSTLKGHIHLRARGERDHAIWKYAGHGGQHYFETKCPFGMCKQARVVLVLLFIYFFCEGACIPHSVGQEFDRWMPLMVKSGRRFCYKGVFFKSLGTTNSKNRLKMRQIWMTNFLLFQCSHEKPSSLMLTQFTHQRGASKERLQVLYSLTLWVIVW